MTRHYKLHVGVHIIINCVTLIVDILMGIHLCSIDMQLSKRVSTDQCHMTVSRAQVYNSIARLKHQSLSLSFPCDDLTLTYPFKPQYPHTNSPS